MMADALLLPMGMPFTSGIALGNGTINLNASTVSYAVTFRSLTTAAITRLGIRRSSVVGTPPTYKISLQGVNSSGDPDGVIKASGNAMATFLGASLAAGWNWLSLTSSYTPSRGELLSIVVEYSSGTVDGSNFLVPVSNAPGANVRLQEFPAYSTGASGVYTRTQNNPIYGYGTSTTAYGWPLNSQSTTTINSSEAGALFTLPSGWGSTFKVAAARFFMSTIVVGKTMTATLYNGGEVGDTTPLQTVDIDTDLLNTTGGFLDCVFDEATLSTLNFGSAYRIALSTADASNQIIRNITTAVADDMAAWQLGGQFNLSTRAGGNWTDTPTSRLLCELILADITGGGGAPRFGPSSSLLRGIG